MTSSADIRTWLIEQIAAILSLSEDDIDPAETFDSFGLASRDAVSLSGDLEDYLGRRLSPTLLYQYPTINKLAEHLAATDPSAPTSGGRAVGATGSAAGEASPGSAPLAGNSAQAESSDDAPARALSDEEAEAALLRKLLELDE